MSKKTLAIILMIVLVLTFAVLLSFILNIKVPPEIKVNPLDYDKVDKTVRFEIIKYLLQLLVVAIIGGSIAYLFKLEEDKRKNENTKVEEKRKDEAKLLEERRQDEAKLLEEQRKEAKIKVDIRLDYFNRLGSIYRSIKNARRVLRSKNLTTKYVPNPGLLSETQVSSYLEQMEQVNKAQLELEGLKIEARSLPAFVYLEGVVDKLKSMEEYLRQLLKEFEQYSPLLNSKQQIDFLTLERLNEFTGTTNRSFPFRRDPNKSFRFKENFSTPYSEVIKIIGRNLE
jgi:hypothetical protein